MPKLPDEIAKIRAEIARKKRERERQARQIDSLIKQRRAEAGNASVILHFYGETTKAVALVQITDDNFIRITRYTDIGPMGHTEVRELSKLADELYQQGFSPIEDPNAGVLLEEWSRRQRWAEGLVSAELIAIGNALRFHGHYDVAYVVEKTRSVKMGYYHCRQLGVTVDGFGI